MIERLEPLTTFALEEADFSASDLAAEMERYVQRQKAIAACLDGTEHPDVVLDMLEAHSIDPVAYVDAVCENVAIIIQQGIPVNLWG
jgi:hypothetical protein